MAGITEAAAVTKRYFGNERAIIMTAIGAAESVNFTDLSGDNLSIFSPGDQALYEPWSCGGDLSFGFLQVFLGVHHELIRNLSGLDTPCEWADWLRDFDNCARAAYQIFVSRGGGTDYGYTAWSTYNGGQYLAFIDAATAAVNQGAPYGLGVARPNCSDGPYSARLSWQGRDADTWVDISTDGLFETFANRYVESGNLVNAPELFSVDWQLLPDVTYHWRIWDGFEHVIGPNFTVPNCQNIPRTPPDNSGGTPSSNPREPVDYPYEADPNVILESFDLRHRTAMVRQNLADSINVIEGASI